MKNLNKIKRVYLKIVGAGMTLGCDVNFEYSRGFLMTSAMCFILPVILVVSVILNIVVHGLSFLMTPQFILATLGALAAYAISVQRASERIEAITKAFRDSSKLIRLTANGAVIELFDGGIAEVGFRSQPAGTCIISILVPTASVPLSFKLNRNEVEAVSSKSGIVSKLLTAMLENGIRTLEFKGSPSTKLKFPRKVVDKPGIWIRAELVSPTLEEVSLCMMKLIDTMNDREFVATFAKAIIESGSTKYDVSEMYNELLSYHKVFFGDKAKAVLDKLIKKISITNKISRDLAIVMAWRRVPHNIMNRVRRASS